MDKKKLTERDICTKFINPALAQAGWDIQNQVREEFSFTAGRIIVRGRLHTRAQAVVVVFRLNDGQGHVLLVLQNIVGSAALAPGVQATTNDDAASGEGELFPNLVLDIPTSLG